MPKKRILRTNNKTKRWCRLEVELTFTEQKPDRLSIHGSEGSFQLADDLREQAHEYWRCFFEESPEELGRMLKDYTDSMVHLINKHDSVEDAAAALVLEVDGEFHGLDVDGVEDEDGYLLVLESCGQIRKELAEFFPEVKPWFKWHLNDMKASCEHQEALGWDGQKDIALTRDTCTPIQLDVLDREFAAKVEKKRIAWIDMYLKSVQEADLELNDKNKVSFKLSQLLREALPDGKVNKNHIDIMRALNKPWTKVYLMASYIDPKSVYRSNYPHNFTRKEVRETLDAVIRHMWKLSEDKYPDKPFRHQVFEKGMSAPCPECGYRYGTKWLKRELPSEVVDWFFGLEENNDA